MSPIEETPKRVGRYRVTGWLGSGGMGEVFQGHDEKLDRPVALKRLLPDRVSSEEARLRFRREAQITTRVRHASIVEVYKWIEDPDGDWLVMERVDGRGLDDLLAEGPLATHRIVSLAEQIAEALAALHKEGFVHRDLKPANIMTTQGGVGTDGERVKLIDFGLARSIESPESDSPFSASKLTAEGEIPGTLAWMSPEQAIGWPVDARSDLFCLGTLIYTMISGVSPFKGRSALESLRRVCVVRETPLEKLVPSAPRELIALVDRLLDKEPARRPQNARQVIEALKAVLLEVQPLAKFAPRNFPPIKNASPPGRLAKLKKRRRIRFSAWGRGFLNDLIRGARRTDAGSG